MKGLTLTALLIAGFFVSTALLNAQGMRTQVASVLVPDSTKELPEDIGKRAHTNHLVLVSPDFTGTSPAGETPGSLACVYATVSPIAGCPISTSTTVPTGGSGTVAIVDAFDYPTAENDLNVFSAAFRLPACTTANGCFRKVYATGIKPKKNCGWAQEAALDIEWAHAMTPGAKIVLVEAASNSFADLLFAVTVANRIVNPSGNPVGTGLGQVSMSWGGSEFSSETSLDSHFTTSGVVYFAASGDAGGRTIWPGVSPHVVCTGGTSIHRNSTTGNFAGETGWSGSGGGPSTFEARPPYQNVIVGIVGTKRGAPDFSFDADPNSGVSVFDSTACQGVSGWLVFGGTSVASPSLAGIVNLAGSKYSSTSNELTTIYSCYSTASCYASDFRDITSGTAGSFTATTGWDFVTGVGSDRGLAMK